MFGWILVIIAVLAILNAEKLPALRQMLEEKFKDSVVAAKVLPPTNAILSSRFTIKEMLSRTFTPLIVLERLVTVSTSLPISLAGRKSM